MSALKHQEGGDHYAKLRIQPIEYIHGNQIGFAEGNVIKYVTRWRDKGGIADLKKARHFLDLLIELETREEKVSALDDVNQKKFNLEQFVKCQKSIHEGMTADQAIKLHDGTEQLIYSDTGYTEQDMQAASLVHDALRWAMTTPRNDDAKIDALVKAVNERNSK